MKLTHTPFPAAFALATACVLFAATAFAETDTAYGPVEIVPKRKTTASDTLGLARSMASDLNDEGDSSESCGSAIAGVCLEACMEVCMSIAFQMASNAAAAIGASIQRSTEPERFDDRRLYGGVSGGAGLLHYPDISTGSRATAMLDLWINLGPAYGVRGKGGIATSANHIYADFQRQVITDHVDTLYTITHKYRNWSYPVLAEFFLRPAGTEGTFFLAAGGGVVPTSEWIEGVAFHTSLRDSVPVAINGLHVYPAISASAGWLLGGRSLFWHIGFDYAAVVCRGRNEEELPSRNTGVAHTAGISAGILF